jgi:dolichol-phosphate mannosyltransferase
MVLVVIPTYNERENLPGLIQALVAQPETRVMVVDDNSPDGTGALADGLVQQFPGRVDVIHRTGRRGLGRSYIEGLQAALKTDAEFICQMDADWSHDPKYLPAIVEACRNADVVIGSRYLQGVSVVNWPLRRIVLSTFANRYIHVILGLRARDCTSGYRCWRREMLARLPLASMVSDGYAFLVEMLFEAHRRGARVGEVPIIFVERREGVSKLSGSVIMESALTPWRLRLRSIGRSAP